MTITQVPVTSLQEAQAHGERLQAIGILEIHYVFLGDSVLPTHNMREFFSVVSFEDLSYWLENFDFAPPSKHHFFLPNLLELLERPEVRLSPVDPHNDPTPDLDIYLRFLPLS